ncbi:MAG: macro domain-containing protein [Chitinivibrionales bacterium]
MQQMIQNRSVECIQGDIADQPDMEAVVNAANAELRIGGGVAGAIHRAAGPGLALECEPLAPITPGQAVITGAHNLPNRYVIHCLGPVYGVDEPSEELLSSCYSEALRLAEQNGVSSVGFPAISTGAFGYPMRPAARVAFSTIADVLPELSVVKYIRFVLFNEEDVRTHEEILKDLVE